MAEGNTKIDRVVSIIPARGGSKGIPRKNLENLKGCPLIVHSIRTSLECPLIERTIVSTNDKEIAEIAIENGAEVPFMRPEEISLDSSLDFPLFKHAIDWLKENENYRPNIIVQLRPTSPFRPHHLISKAIEKFVEFGTADSLRGVSVSSITPYKMYKIENKLLHPVLTLDDTFESYNMPRQLLPKVYLHGGWLDIFWTKTLEKYNSITGNIILPFIIDNKLADDINMQRDLLLAEKNDK